MGISQMKLPKQIDQLERAGQHIVAGLHLHAKTLDIPNSVRTSAESALRDLAASDARYDKPSPIFMHTIGPALAKAHFLSGSSITRAKEALRPHLGEEWSAAWAQAGFQNSLQTPGTGPERIELLDKLTAYFKAHPEHEVPTNETTAAHLAKRSQELQEAFHQSTEHSRAWSIGVSCRTQAAERVRSALQNVLGELERNLPPSDPRWADFVVGKGLPAQTAPKAAPSPTIPAALGALAAPVEALPARRRGRPRKHPLPDAPRSVPVAPQALHEGKSDSAAEFQLWKYACQLAEKAKVQADQARETLARAEAGLQRLRSEAEQAMTLAKSLQAKADLLAPAGSKPARNEGSRSTGSNLPLVG